VELPAERDVILAFVISRLVIKALTALKNCEKNVEEVEFIALKSCVNRLVALANEMTADDATSEEIEASALVRRLILPEDTTRLVMVVVERFDDPRTFKLPPTLRPPVVEALDTDK
jgi:hypothetical protein